MERAKGKVFLCFGGGSGMGEATVRRFADEGASVVIADMNEDSGKKIVEEIAAKSGKAVFIKTDCTDEASVQNAVNCTVKEFGRVDVSFYTPGTNMSGAIDTLDLDRWNKGIALNFTGVFLYLKHMIAQMKKNEGGVIFTLSSQNSLSPYSGFGNYCATKAGVDMLTKVAAMEAGRFNIRVLSINPSFVKTPLVSDLASVPAVVDLYSKNTALGRVAEPEEIASVVLSMSTEDFRYFTGVNVFVDGGAQHYGYPDMRSLFQASGVTKK